MDDKEIFSLVRENYNNANADYLKNQAKTALRNPTLSKEETIDGLVNWIIDAGCTGLNDRYRQFVFSAIGHLQSDSD